MISSWLVKQSYIKNRRCIIIYKVSRLYLQNHARINSKSNLTEIELNFDNSNLFIFLGGNGSGKSSLIDEITPFVRYGVFMKDKVGIKEISFRDDIGNGLDIKYVATPNKDTHSMKCYINKIEHGASTEVNADGMITRGVLYICEYFGIESGVIDLLNISNDKLFIVNKTYTERIAFLKSIIKPLEDFDEVSKNVNPKILYFKTSIAAKEKVLSSKKGATVIESLIENSARELKLLEDMKMDKHKIVSSLVSELDNLKRLEEEKSLVLGDYTELNNLRKSIIKYPIGDVKDYQNETLISYQDKLTSEIQELTEMISKNDILQSQLSHKMDLNRMRNIVSDIPIDDSLYSKLIVEFGGLTDSEKESIDIASLEIDNMKLLMQALKNMQHLRNELLERMSIKDFTYYLENDVTDARYEISKIAESIANKKKLLETMKSDKIKNGVYASLSVYLSSMDDKCSTCGLQRAVADGLSVVNDIQDHIANFEIEIESLQSDMSRVNSYVDKASRVRQAEKLFNSTLPFTAKLLPDFNYLNVMINGNITEVMDKLDDKKKFIERYKMYKNALLQRQIALELGDVNIDAIKVQYTSTNEMSKTYAIQKNNLNMYLTNLKKIISTLSDRFRGKFISNKISEYTEGNIIFTIESNLSYLTDKVKDMKDKLGFTDSCKTIEDFEKRLKFDIEDMQVKITNANNALVKLKAEKIEIDNLTSALQYERVLYEELALIGRVTNKVVTSKITDMFMLRVIHNANQYFKDTELPYRVYDKSITETEFNLPILDMESETESIRPDVCMMSSGEKGIVGSILGISTITSTSISLGYITIDECDAFASEANRIKYATMITDKLLQTDRQIFMVSHNPHVHKIVNAKFIILSEDYLSLVNKDDIIYNITKDGK